MFKKHPKLKKFYNLVLKNDNKLQPEQKAQVQFEREFLSKLFNQYLHILKSIPEKGIDCASCTCICIYMLDDVESKICILNI